MYSTTVRAYDDAFVKTTVEFGNGMAQLRQYRDQLSSQYRELQLKKLDLVMAGKSTVVVQSEMDEVARTKNAIADEIDKLMAVQTNYLSSCMHARA